MKEYICTGELANLYYALSFLEENLAASREHVEALKDLLTDQYSKQTGESKGEALICFDEWRHSGEPYIGNSRGAGRRRYKLSENDVVAIQQAKADGQTIKAIAAKYGVSGRYIRKL